MRDYFSAASACGRDMTVRSAQAPTGRSVRGYIQPLDPRDAKSFKRRTRPGVITGGEYLLIVGPSALSEGETEVTVSTGGRLYELLGAEQFTIGGAAGHWEGVLRLKGADEDA